MVQVANPAALYCQADAAAQQQPIPKAKGLAVQIRAPVQGLWGLAAAAGAGMQVLHLNNGHQGDQEQQNQQHQ